MALPLLLPLLLLEDQLRGSNSTVSLKGVELLEELKSATARGRGAVAVAGLAVAVVEAAGGDAAAPKAVGRYCCLSLAILTSVSRKIPPKDT